MLRSRRMVAAVLCLFLSSLSGWAQTPTGGIEGTITDSTGAVVSGAKVTVLSQGTGQANDTTTNSSGLYSFRNLDPGSYTVKIQASGFSTLELKNLSVSASVVTQGSGSLEIGNATSVVEVAEQAEAVDTVSQTVQSVISTTEIKNLPLFSRNFLDLATLAPGTTVRDGGAIDPTKSNAYRTVGIAGRSGTATRVQVDGVDITDETVGTTTANVSQDAVAEFNLERSSLDPSTSLTSSGAINIITKTGSNQLHGTSFFDYTNGDLSARQNYNTTVPDTSRKRYGAGVGGPLWKNKLFAYGNLEKSDQQQGQIFNSATFPQFDSQASLPLTYQYALGRLDWNISQSVRAFYEFLHSDDLSTGGTVISPYQNVDWTNTHILGLTVSSARLTHNFRFGTMRFHNHIDSSQLSFQFPTYNGVPYQLNISNVSAGPNGLAPQQTYQNNYQWSYEGSYLVGKHSLRYGVDVRHIVLGGFANFAGPLNVSLQYDAGTVAALQAAGKNIQDPLNYPLTDFGTGPNAGFFTVRPATGLPHGGHFDTRTGTFIQDSFKVTPRLTINLGVRWQYDTDYFADPRIKRDPNFDLFIQGASKNPVFPKDAFSPSAGFAWDVRGSGKTVIRGGFYRAYEMNIFNNTIFDEYQSIPSGIGPDTYTSAGVNGPDGSPINVNNHPDGIYTDLQGQPLSAVIPTITQVDTLLKAAYANYKFDPTKGIPTFDNTRGVSFGGPFPGNQYRIPYSLQYNIGVQHQISPGLVLTADFVYNHGIGLPLTREDFNRRRAAYRLDPAVAQSEVKSVLGGSTVDQYIAANPGATIGDFGLANDGTFPGTQYPNFLYGRFITGGFSKYYALQMSLRGRFRDTFAFKDNFLNVAYARATTQDSGGVSRAEFIAGALNNDHPNDRHYFGPTSLDYRHTLTVAMITRVPLGIRLNTITQFHTAAPIGLFVPDFGGGNGGPNYLFTTDLNGDGGNSSSGTRPDLIPGLDLNQFGRNVANFSDLNKILTNYNTSVAGTLTPAGKALVNAGIFTEAQMKALGAVVQQIPLVDSSAPNPFHSLFTTDLRFDRPVKIKEKWQITPFADFINLFNHAPLAEYGGLGGTFGSYNFDYSQPGQTKADLALQQGRLNGTRQIQFGIRFDF